jgi:putative spermidine/putrescine transport system ATP-binding protein
MMSRLTIRELTKLYADNPAVQDFDLDVAEGEFVSLLGPSGCGKTTTLRCVAGLEVPTSGQIRFGDREVTRLPAEKRNIGMVFQNYALFPHMTVAENVSFGLEMRGCPGGRAWRKVNAVMDMVQLGGLHERHPRQLSGGQQQRVALARALVVEPALLLLDEPLANLDARLRDEMRVFIRSLQQRVGITTLYVTHDQAEAMTISDRIVVMFNGRIHQIGSPREIYHRPSTREVANFIGQSNLFAGKVIALEDTRLVVETAVGLMRCDGPSDVAVGTEGHVMLRPEAIRLVRACNGFPGRITEQHFLGNVVDYRVKLPNGKTISVQAIGEATPRTDDEVGLLLDESRAWLLP